MRLILFIVTFLFSCSKSTTEQNMVVNPNASASKYSFLSLGDSYTIGESVSASDRWSVQLAGMLRNQGLDVADPDIIARTGWTTAELQDAINSSGNQKKYTLVSLMIGVNNQYRGQSQDRYRTEFKSLLQTAVNFANGKADHVFVLSTPDWGRSPYASTQDKTQIGLQIDQFNAIAKDECQKAGIAFVDITPATRAAAGDDSQFASDGLHYSGKQMQKWAEMALPVAKKLLTL
ncbi:SGNH/GDSL hydrolase family protein [Spirosoma spitsbergense]|jgi:lysophospholipase L1-like esterase|uniref:SGNH/GDSL hydrolase family protein n=1 Tax=Spirosoma spitsbergense TaxID=431554 RepID=UPI000475EB5F|nr:SGNH/GDSL hydrolase family protein [Spirosoma spitsbergense]